MATTYQPETQGEIGVMPRDRRNQLIAGIVTGSVLMGFFVMFLFTFMIERLGYANQPMFMGLAMFGGALMGALFGPIIAMIFRRRTVKRMGL